MAEPVFHRIHPLTIVVELGRVIRQFALLILFLGFQFFTGSLGQEAGFEVLGTALGAVVLIPAVLRYYSFGYAIHQGKLLVKSGIITKNLRTIPLDRIQNINFTRSLVHRLVGLVDLDIETASSAKAEASISALTDEQARILKAQLLRETPKLTSFVHDEMRKKVVYKPSNWELFLVGASENRLPAMIAAVAGLGIFGNSIENFIEKIVQNFAGVTNQLGKGWVLWTTLLVLMLLVGWIVSIVATFIKYYGFELTEDGDGKLKRTYGLINHIENVLPLNRLQTVVYRQNILQKYLKIGKLYASTAGGFGEQKKESGQAEIQQSPLLTPVVRDDAFPALLRTSFLDVDVVDPAWNRVGKKTILRHLRSTVTPALILGIVPNFVPNLIAGRGLRFTFIWQSPAVFFGVLALGLFAGAMHYRFAKWADLHDILISASGWIWHRRHYLPVSKVQAVGVRQSPVQRFLGLATIELSSAAPTFQTTEIDDLPADKVEELAYSVHDRSGRGRDSLVDGF